MFRRAVWPGLVWEVTADEALDALAAGNRNAASISDGVASARYLRRAGPGDDAGPGWNCLRGSIGLAWHLRSVRNDRTAAGLRIVRPQPHPRSGTGLGAGGRHPRCCHSVVRWRSSSRRNARCHDGDRFGDGMHSGRHRAPGFCHRAALQADTVRLYERNCIDRIDQPLPKFFGFSVESKGPLRDLWAIADAILEGKTNWVAFGVGLGTLLVILLLKDSKRLPGILIAVVGATVGRRCAWSWDPLRREGFGSSSPRPARLRHSLDRIQ